MPIRTILLPAGLAGLLLAAPATALVQDDGPPPKDDPKPVAGGGTEFVALSIADARSRAEREEKMLLVFWVSPTFRDCERMRRTTWKDDELGAWTRENCIAVSVDVTENPDAANAQKVRTLPTTDLVDMRDGLLERAEGYHDAPDLIATFVGAALPDEMTGPPEGDDANDPYAWLAYGNQRWRLRDFPDEAVRAYVWCLTRADEFVPGFRERYFEYLCKRIAYMKAHTVEGYSALKRERRRLETIVFQGEGDRRTVYELVRLDFWLREQIETKQMYKALLEHGDDRSQEAAWLFPHVLEDMCAWRWYDEILQGVGEDPVAYVRSRFEKLEAIPEGAEVPEEEQDDRGTIVNHAASIYEALLQAGRGKDARDLLQLVTERVGTARVWAQFMRASNRLELYAVTLQTGEKALEAIQGPARKRIERALMQIPGYSGTGDDDGSGDGGGR